MAKNIQSKILREDGTYEDMYPSILRATNNVVGDIKESFSNNQPNGWVKCDGSIFTRDQYPELYDELRAPKITYNYTVAPNTYAPSAWFYDNEEQTWIFAYVTNEKRYIGYATNLQNLIFTQNMLQSGIYGNNGPIWKVNGYYVYQCGTQMSDHQAIISVTRDYTSTWKQNVPVTSFSDHGINIYNCFYFKNKYYICCDNNYRLYCLVQTNIEQAYTNGYASETKIVKLTPEGQLAESGNMVPWRLNCNADENYIYNFTIKSSNSSINLYLNYSSDVNSWTNRVINISNYLNYNSSYTTFVIGFVGKVNNKYFILINNQSNFNTTSKIACVGWSDSLGGTWNFYSFTRTYGNISLSAGSDTDRNSQGVYFYGGTYYILIGGVLFTTQDLINFTLSNESNRLTINLISESGIMLSGERYSNLTEKNLPNITGTNGTVYIKALPDSKILT